MTQQLLFSTLRIETLDGDRAGVATGFIVMGDHDGNSVPFLVTNRHVVAGWPKGRLFFIRREGDRPKLGVPYELTIHGFQDAWTFHPDERVDVAVMPLMPAVQKAEDDGFNVFFRALPTSACASPDQMAELDAVEELLFVGYPNGIYDGVNHLPIVRRGITASPPSVDFDGLPQFLIDASVFPGSSGSPVVIANQGSYATAEGITIGSRFMLLGLVASVAYREDDSGRIEFRSIPTQVVPQVTTREMLDLGFVLKARTILETVEAFMSMNTRVS